MIAIYTYVFNDDKLIRSGLKSIKPLYIPLLPHKYHFLCHARPVNWRIQIYGINSMIEVDLYVFNDEKLIRSGLKPINHHIMYNIYHIYLCHFLCHATFMPFFVPYDYKKNHITLWKKKHIIDDTHEFIQLQENKSR